MNPKSALHSLYILARRAPASRLRLTIVIFPLLAMFALPGRLLGPVPSGAEAADESARAAEFFENAFEERLSRSPMRLTQLGRKDDNDKWDEISDARAEEDLAIAKRQYAELKDSIDYSKLDAQAKLSYDLFTHEIERQIKNFEWRFHTYPINQMRGWQSTIPAFLINYHRIDSFDDAKAYILRLKGVEPLFDQVIDNLEARAAKNIIPPKFCFSYIRNDAENVIKGTPFDDSGDDSTILADFRSKVGKLDVSEENKTKLMQAAERALRRNVKPAYEKLIQYTVALERNATTDDGAWKFPDGDAYYRQMLENMTTVKLSPNEIHDTGLREVARIHDEMRQIMRKVEFKGTLQEFFVFLREDKQFYYEETQEGRQAYLDRAVEIIDEMRTKLDGLFVTKPKADIIVKAVEPFREKSAGKAFYQRPAPDGSRPGIYYANLYRMSDMPIYQMEALAYHEGIPGHHMQLAIAIELDDLPKFRRYARYTAHTEGWGLYCEYVPKEIGLYQDPYSDFGRLAMELWRACRLVVDTGIHDKRWTREQAIDYLVDNTPNPRGDAVKAIERYIVMPGQATAYKIGMMKILELRENARRQLGEGFDIRGFHDVVLRNGPVPLTVLEKLVDNWISETQSDNGKTGS